MTDFSIAVPAVNFFGGCRDPLECPGSGIAFRSISSISQRHMTGLSFTDIILSDNDRNFAADLSSSKFIDDADPPHMELEFIKNYTLHHGVNARCRLHYGKSC